MNANKTMRAAVATAYGGPEVVRVVDVPRPDPGPGQVRIRVEATTVSAGDRRIRALDVPGGLRTLTRSDPGYIGSYGGNDGQRAAAYHQGTVWSWLLGPFVEAHLRVYNDLEQAQTFLVPLFHHLSDYGVGNIADVFDGDPPFTPRGCIAKAWSVGEFLRICQVAFMTMETQK